MLAADRIAMTLGCRDTDAIPKVADAGRVVADSGHAVQVMHNGTRVVAGAYHGDWMGEIISRLRGHHEPQEECIFHRLVDCARPGTLMVELASFWAYYALWYLRDVPGSHAICVEPDPMHMAVGRRNAALNGVTERVSFVEAWVGQEARAAHVQVCESSRQPRTLPCLDMDALMDEAAGRPIELLHMDAQGAELGFLLSMRNAVAADKVRFAMISTHHATISGSASTHADCLAAVRDLGGVVLIEFGVSQSFSGDGLIAASFCKDDRSLQMPSVSRNQQERSLFPHG
jgi:FkbM family methyltransferase